MVSDLSFIMPLMLSFKSQDKSKCFFRKPGDLVDNSKLNLYEKPNDVDNITIIINAQTQTTQNALRNNRCDYCA